MDLLRNLWSRRKKKADDVSDERPEPSMPSALDNVMGQLPSGTPQRPSSGNKKKRGDLTPQGTGTTAQTENSPALSKSPLLKKARNYMTAAHRHAPQGIMSDSAHNNPPSPPRHDTRQGIPPFLPPTVIPPPVAAPGTMAASSLALALSGVAAVAGVASVTTVEPPTKKAELPMTPPMKKAARVIPTFYNSRKKEEVIAERDGDGLMYPTDFPKGGYDSFDALYHDMESWAHNRGFGVSRGTSRFPASTGQGRKGHRQQIQ
jgi:hypothetical protein